MILWTYLEFRQTIVDFHVTVLDSTCQVGLLDEVLECAFRAPLIHTINDIAESAGSLSSEPIDAHYMWRRTSGHQRLISAVPGGEHPRPFSERRPRS